MNIATSYWENKKCGLILQKIEVAGRVEEVGSWSNRELDASEVKKKFCLGSL